jgi:hypothetical protein
MKHFGDADDFVVRGLPWHRGYRGMFGIWCLNRFRSGRYRWRCWDPKMSVAYKYIFSIIMNIAHTGKS